MSYYHVQPMGQVVCVRGHGYAMHSRREMRHRHENQGQHRCLLRQEGNTNRQMNNHVEGFETGREG